MPMVPLRPAFEEACKKFKLDPAAHALALPAGAARRAPLPVELDVPFRLLPNVPSGARLEVVLAAGKAGAAVAAAAAAAPKAVAAPPAPPKAEPATAAATAAAQAGPSAAAQPDPEPAAPTGPLASLGVRFPVHIFHRRALEAQAEAAAAKAKAAAEAAAQEQQQQQQQEPSNGAPPAPSAKNNDEEEDDSFFEFTAEDWALAQRAADRRRREQEARPFTTQAQRDAAMRARAESFGPVPVRLHYPDGSIAQAEFAATDALFSVWELAARLASAELAGVGSGEGSKCTTTTTTNNNNDSLPLYLYTAPPKTVIKDLSVTLYQAGLVPAANLHVGSSAPSAQRQPAPPSLRSEARALMSEGVPPVRLQRPRRADDDDDEDNGARRAGKGKAPLPAGRGGAMGLLSAMGGGGGGGAARGGGGGGGAPAWLKMGGRK
jgi:tether containing UBX domain for GLUT4